jgi:ABC-type sugar transport system ATPase subunit
MVVIKVVGCCSAGEVRLAVQAALGRRTRRVQALAGASLAIEAGETMALVGDNGAGKSTFVKPIFDSERAEAGGFAR